MSIEVNAGTRAVNWESLLSSLGQVEKTGAADGKTDFTITTKVDGEVKTMTVSIPDDLELPESIDKGVLDGLVDKLANANLGFTDEQIAKMKDSIAELYGAAGQAISDVNAKSRGNLLFDLYALMALLIDVAQSQRDAARDMRTAQNMAIQKSIQDQADKQREAARVGMILGIVCGAASALASGITMGLQGIAASQQNKIASQSGADAAKMHSAALQNTDTVEHGQTQYLQTTQKLGNDIALRVGNDFDAQIANDPAGNLKTKLDTANARVEAAQQNLDAKNIELQGARDTLDQKTQALSSARRAKQTYIRDQMSAGQDADPAELAKHDTRIANARNEMEAAQRDVQLKQGAVDLANTELTNAKTAQTQAKSDYVKTVQDIAAQYEERYQTAVDRLANPPEGASKAQLEADVAAARKDMEMAFAKEAKLLSEDGVLSPSDKKDLVKAARIKVDDTMDRVYKRADYKLSERKLSTLMGINNINQAAGGVLQSAVQNYSAIKSSDATRQGAETQREEEMLDQTKDLFQQEQKLIDQVVQLFAAVIQAESQSMRDAIQA